MTKHTSESVYFTDMIEDIFGPVEVETLDSSFDTLEDIDHLVSGISNVAQRANSMSDGNDDARNFMRLTNY